ncbi:MAG TPA: DNA polymerase III subunit delta [Bryobacteraceae bacterium]|nr:DNA polymerase III subunit delta [Bryobacteraceae bacterium]
MSPDQFLSSLKNGPAPVCLFVGPEAFQRERCRRELIRAALGDAPEDRESGFARHDLDQVSLAAALDDARALSLFASRRVIWIVNAEAALPRTRAAAPEEDTESGGDVSELAAYLRDPAPGTVVVFDASRYEFEGDDKAKLERVRKFYAAVAVQVEFRSYSPEAVRSLAQGLAKQAGLLLGLAELAVLIEATGGDAARIAVEIEKLRLFTGGARKVTAEDIAALVPDAQQATIFALVAALGRGDRLRAFEILDTLAREGEYMPLALTFLATQFRMALVAREAGLRNSQQIQAHFTRLGARIWPERARQIEQTVNAFSKERLQSAAGQFFEADRALRGARPDDRIVMEEMILALTA